MRLLFIYISLALYSPFNGIAQSNEYTLKAGFIEKFAHFSEWPEKTIEHTFKIGILGNNPFNGELEALYSNHKIKDKPVEIIYLKGIEQAKTCHIVFIAACNKDRLNLFLESVQNLPILTISDTKGYAKKGVIVNFYHTAQSTIHFKINSSALKKSGVVMDLMLLEYAKIIDE